MDRNFWDEATPPGFTDQREQRRVVELCVYSFEGSAKDLEQIRADVEEADPDLVPEPDQRSGHSLGQARSAPRSGAGRPQLTDPR